MRDRPRFFAAVRRSPWWVIASLCFALPAQGGEAAAYVRPVKWARYAGKLGVRSDDAFGRALVTILQDESRYELRWVQSDHKLVTDLTGWEGIECYYPRFGVFGGQSYEQAVRPLAGFAYGMAVMLETGIYSPQVAGVSVDEARHRTELAIRGVALTNVANMPSGPNRWGQGLSGLQSWEAALWASHAAEAAWWMWDHLSPETRSAVANMAEHEANTFLHRRVPYWKDRHGKTIYPGDTKAEENAWNSHLLAVAQAMMPRHPNAPGWRRKASEYQVSAYSRPSDLTNDTVVDGKRVRDWLNGYNAFEDGVVLNHNRIHPDYLVCHALIFASMIDVSLARQPIPPSMVFNADVTYRALTELRFVPGDHRYAPGRVDSEGTIYCRTLDGNYCAQVHYPQTPDWTTKLVDCYLNTDLIAEYLGLDAGKHFDAMGWAWAHVRELRALQTRPGHKGNIYGPGDWKMAYRGTEEIIFQSNAAAWMEWWLMQNHLMSRVGVSWTAY